MSVLADLALRCAAARSNSWDLDRDIFRAVALPDIWFGSKVVNWFGDGPFGCNTEDGIRHLDCINAPNYTASIDAAISLVPECHYWHVGHGRTRDDEPLGGASIIKPGSLDTLAEGEAVTAALALCVAALRARALLAAPCTIRAGDIVHHASGEEWVVAYVDGDYLGMCGWPAGEAKLSDCTLKQSCSDEEHLMWLRQIAKSDGKRARMATSALEALGAAADIIEGARKQGAFD